MIRELQTRLRPVRRRLTLQRAMGPVATALMTGGWLALMGALLTLLGGSMTSGLIGAAVAVAFPLLALLWALLRPASWLEAAQLVDRRLRLHNRTSTALQLSERASDDPFAGMQIEDAAAHLRQANLSSISLVVPRQRLAGGVVLTAFSLGLIAWGILSPPTESIQTSGQMQDMRPEIIPRKRVDLGPPSSAVIAQSTRISPSLPPECAVRGAHDERPRIGETVSDRYFDLLEAAHE